MRDTVIQVQPSSLRYKLAAETAGTIGARLAHRAVSGRAAGSSPACLLEFINPISGHVALPLHWRSACALCSGNKNKSPGSAVAFVAHYLDSAVWFQWSRAAEAYSGVGTGCSCF